MPIFKVWNLQRSIKKFVIANSLEEFKEKCTQKLSLKCATSSSLKIVLEKDGTEVDEYEELYLLQSEVLIALQECEVWYDSSFGRGFPITNLQTVASVPSVANFAVPAKSSTQLVVPPPLLPSSKPLPIFQEPCSSSCISSPEQLSPNNSFDACDDQSLMSKAFSQCHDSFPTIEEPSELYSIAEIASVASPSPLQIITEHTPLPNFSHYVLMHLTKGDSSSVWNTMIDECARYYLNIYPRMGERSAYKAIGQEMLRVYPAIAHDGQNPWTYFATSLSGRIRRIRWTEKHKGGSSTSLKCPTEKASSTLVAPYPIMLSAGSNQETFENEVLELQKACTQPKENRYHIQMLLKDTFRSRRDWIESLQNLRVQTILQKFPCFDKGNMVLHELGQILGVDVLARVSRNMPHFKELIKTKTVFCSENCGPYEELEFIDFLFQETLPHRGKGEKYSSFIEVHENVEDVEAMCRHSATTEENLKLLIFLDNGTVNSARIAGEDVQIDTEARTIFGAVLVLIAVYYSCSLQYPRPYSQVLAVLQEYWLEDKYQGFKCRKYYSLVQKLSQDGRYI